MKHGSSISSNSLSVPPYLRSARLNVGRLLTPVLVRSRHFVAIPAIFLLWEVGVRLHWINGDVLPAPSATVHALIDLAQAGYLWRDVGASIMRVTIGFGFAAVIGI